MEKWIHFFLRRKLLVYLVTVLILFAGFASLATFKVALMPKTNLPWIEVAASGGSLPPEEMEEKVTDPIEQELKGISGIKEYTSNTRTGSSRITVVAESGKASQVKQDVQNAVNRLRNVFPSEVDEVEVIQASFGEEFLMGLALSGSDLQTMYNLAETSIKEKIEAVPGVQKVEVYDSNVTNKVRITFQPDRLLAYRLTPQDAMEQLRAANWRQAVGKLENDGFNTVIELDQTFASIQQIGEVTIRSAEGAVPLRQLALIEDLRGYSDEALFTYNGDHFVTMNVFRTDESDVIQTQAQVQAVIDQINKEAAGNYQITSFVEAASFVKHAISNLSRDVLIGGALAVIILFFFLKNWRVTLVIATTIPLSVLMTFIAMKMGGYNIDLVTLISLSLSVGLMVDAAIVVLESIYQQRERGEPLFQAIQKGTAEVFTPVLASQLTIVVVFLPLVFVSLGGEELQQVFVTIAFTVTVAIISSTIAAFLFVPVYSDSFLKNDKNVNLEGDAKDRPSLIERWATGVLELSLRHRWKTILLAALLLGSVFLLAPYLKMGQISNINENYIRAELILPKGSSLDEAQKVALAADKTLQELHDVQDIYLEAYEERAVLNILILGKTKRELDKDAITLEINSRLKALNDLERVELGWGGGQSETPIALDVTGKDLNVMKQLTDQVEQMLLTIPGAQNPRSQFSSGEEKIILEPKQEIMERLQIDKQSLLSQLRGFLGEQTVATMTVNGVEVDVTARYPDDWMQHPEQFRQIMIQAPNGRQVPLLDIVDWKYSKSPTVLYHQDGTRVIRVTAELAGSDLGTVNRAIQEKLREIPVPAGYSINIAGDLKQQSENLLNGLLVFIGSIALIYLIMVAQFGRLSHPFIIMLTIPMAVVGVVVGLVLTGRELTEMAMVGVIMLIGIVVSNAILLIDRMNLLRERGYELKPAILEAARNRVRPILMTKLTAILGLLPLALAYAEGSDFEAPLATVIIFGLIFHTVVTLVLVPVLYSLFEGFFAWRKKLYEKMAAKRQNWSSRKAEQPEL
ncbi:efflux RND transporter permease subunit [Brevibacillus humidisoli]|uniref:efflux RND transporter permease subunit n=1 Tax=Brevibacillus humidisoli TaxID=2895522 RepID=UPI001E29D5D7|nr:efflux RND transporter permease subunit [Brevibacillus humidisoli]UFJ42727.1 efflux RND transporter permease subunit [Brevibacillus humidisoli]